MGLFKCLQRADLSPSPRFLGVAENYGIVCRFEDARGPLAIFGDSGRPLSFQLRGPSREFVN